MSRRIINISANSLNIYKSQCTKNLLHFFAFLAMMHGNILDLFSGRERKKLFKQLQYLDKKIPLVRLEDEKHQFENIKREIRVKLYGGAPTIELKADLDDLLSKVERHLNIQEDDDYARIIEHLITRDIVSETQIKEIHDPLDRKIVFQHVLLRKRDVFPTLLGTLRRELALVEQMLERMYRFVSEDVEELGTVWRYLLQEEQDKLDDLKQRIDTVKINEIGTLQQDVHSLNDRFACLEKYMKEYLSEQALAALTRDVKEYMPREDITCEEIYKGLGDSIVTELTGCTGGVHKERMIKQMMAKLIYGRLKKGISER